jgi:hypothetical protein
MFDETVDCSEAQLSSKCRPRGLETPLLPHPTTELNTDQLYLNFVVINSIKFRDTLQGCFLDVTILRTFAYYFLRNVYITTIDDDMNRRREIQHLFNEKI